MKLEGCASPHSTLTFPVLLKAAPRSPFLGAEVIDKSWQCFGEHTVKYKSNRPIKEVRKNCKLHKLLGNKRLSTGEHFMVVIQNDVVLSRSSICNRLAISIINSSASSQKRFDFTTIS